MKLIHRKSLYLSRHRLYTKAVGESTLLHIPNSITFTCVLQVETREYNILFHTGGKS